MQDERAGAAVEGCTNPPIHGLLEPTGSILLSPGTNASFVYALSGGEDQPGDVTVLARDASTGALSQVSGVEGCASSTGSDNESAPRTSQPCETLSSIGDAESMVASPDGQNIYVSTNSAGLGSLVELHVDAFTGALSEENTTPEDPDCYTSSAENAGVPGCTPDYRGLSGIGETLTGTLGVSGDGSEVYITGFYVNAVAVFQRSLSPTFTVTGAANPGAEGSVLASSASAGSKCADTVCTVYPNSTVYV